MTLYQNYPNYRMKKSALFALLLLVGFKTYAIDTITLGSLSKNSYCVNEVISIPFTSTLPSGTNFTAQLYKNGQLISSETSINSPFQFCLGTSLVYGNDYTINIISNQIQSAFSPAITIGNIREVKIVDGLGLGSANAFLCPSTSKTMYAKVLDHNFNVVSNNITYKWFKNGVEIVGENQNSIVLNNAGVYTVEASQVCAITSIQPFYLNIVTNNLSKPMNNSQEVACENTIKTLTSLYFSNSTTYQWQKDGVDIPNATQRQFQATETGYYKVKCFENTCTFTEMESKLVFGKSLIAPAKSFSGDTVLCGGNMITLIGNSDNTSDYTFQWQKNGVDIPDANSHVFNATEPGLYSLVYQQGNCTSKSKNINLIASSLSQKPSITVGNQTELCQGTAIIKNAKIDNNDAYLIGSWYKDGVLIPIPENTVLFATESGVYKMIHGQGSCAVESNEITLNFGNTFIPKIWGNNKTNLCGTNDLLPLQLDPSYFYSSQMSYQWQKDGVDIAEETNTYLQVTAPGNYRIVATSSNCVGTSENYIVTNNAPNLTIVSDVNNLNCTNQIASLRITGQHYTIEPGNLQPGVEIVWKRNNIQILSEKSVTVYTNLAGEYTASVNHQGCVGTSAPFVLSSNPVPDAPLVSPVTINKGEIATLQATGCAGTVNWFLLAKGGSSIFTGNTFTSPNLNTTTNYYADCSNATCTSLTRRKVKVTVTGGDVPILIGTISPMYYCANGVISVPFTSSLPQGSVFTVQFYQNGQIIQTASGQSSPILLQLNPNLVVTYVSHSIKIVSEEFSSLENNNIFIENFSSIQIHDGLENSYSGDRLCPGKSKILFTKITGNLPEGPIIYKWYKNNIEIPNASTSTLTVSEEGVYSVKVGESCSAISNNLSITFDPNILAGSIRKTLFDIACINTQIDLTAFYYSNTATYQWQKDGVDIPNANSRVYVASATGNYGVKAIDGECQSAIYTQKLNFTTGILAPIHSEHGDTTLCGGKPINLVAIASNYVLPYSYQWLKDGVNIAGATNYLYVANSPGKYQLAYTEGNCTSKSQVITLIESTKAQKPTISAGNILQICSGTITISQLQDYNYIFNNYPNLSGTWYKNGNQIQASFNTSYTASESGTYHMVYGDSDCAIESNPVTVSINENTFNPKIKVNSYPKTTNLCGNNDIFNNIVLRFDTDFIQMNNVSYQWRLNGVNLNNYTGEIMFAQSPGNYDLVVNNGNCTGISNTITITNNNTISVVPQENNVWCSNRAVQLSIDNNGFYNGHITWKRDNVVIPNENGTTIYAIVGGDYTATVNHNGCNTTSTPLKFNADIPNFGFTTKSGNWNDPLCWICGVLPTASTDVKISTGHIINVPSGTHQVKNVTLEGTVNFESGGEVRQNN